MVLRTCDICDKRFAKTEHFKRHQRSHTKEKPYECTICKKSFSRSDVLFRHAKLHTEGGEHAEGDLNGHRRASMATMGDTSLIKDPSNGVPTPGPGTYPTQSQNGEYSGIHPGLRHVSVPDLAPAFNSQMQHVFPPGPQALNGHRHPAVDLSHQIPSAYHHNAIGTNVDPSLQTSRVEFANAQPGLNGHAYTTPLDSSLDLQGFDGSPSDMLHYWLNQADAEIDFSAIPIPEFMTPVIHFPPTQSMPEPAPSVERSETTSSSSIPDARFAKVAEIWRSKRARAYHFLEIWSDVVGSPFANVFCYSTAIPLEHQQADMDTRWGMNSRVRRLLQSEFSLPSLSRPKPASGSTLNLPPPEVLDICMDAFFRRVHPMVPFIHIPTFLAASTPAPLLFVMCVLGLSAMSTGDGKNFIKQAFLSLRQRIHQDIVRSVTTPTSIEERLSNFATAVLILQLASLSSDKDFMAQSQALYSTVIALAQRQELFNAREGKLDELLPNTMSVQQRWQAWARIESIKRLIGCMLMQDWWMANTVCVSPLIRPEAVQLSLPNDDDLFRAQSAEEWLHLLDAGRNADLPSVRPRTFHLKGCIDNLLFQPHSLQPTTMYALLNVIKHFVSDIQHRHFAQVDDWNGLNRIVPWQTYQLDFRARALASIIISLTQSATTATKSTDLNVMVLWHNLNINLTANLQIFELAAGRCGPVRGANALKDIAEWSQTPSARRACVHAAQTYKLLSQRKVSDTVMLHCMSALFAAALILGLYVFQMPQNHIAGQVPVFDLLGDVDWTLVGEAGLSGTSTSSVDIFDAPQRTPATDFIEFGGPVTIGGVPACGYMPARRVLLDFAQLMDGMGAWKPRTFSRILHIMSDLSWKPVQVISDQSSQGDIEDFAWCLESGKVGRWIAQNKWKNDVEVTQPSPPVQIPIIRISPGLSSEVSADAPIRYVLIMEGAQGALKYMVHIEDDRKNAAIKIFHSALNGISTVFSAAFVLPEYLDMYKDHVERGRVPCLKVTGFCETKPKNFMSKYPTELLC